jgi:hypothetical protein
MHQELEAMRKALVIRNYATKTVGTYVSVLKRFLQQLDKPIKDVTPADIQAWQFVMVNDHKISWSLFNQMVCALRFYFQKVRDCDWPGDRIPFQRVITDVKLPEITDLAFPLFGAKAMGVLGRMESPDYHLPGAAHGQGALYAEGQGPSRTGEDTAGDRRRPRRDGPHRPKLSQARRQTKRKAKA